MSFYTTVPDTVSNIATINYQYSYDLINQIDSSNQTPPSISNLNSARIDNATGGMIKSATPNPMKLGDTITYTVLLTNTGNVTATNIYLTDTLPEGMILAPGSLNPNPPSSIPVSDLAPYSTATITFSVILVTLPQSGEISNTAAVKYTYTIDPSIPDGGMGEGNSNTFVGDAGQAIIDAYDGGFIKTASSEYAIVGDTITYTIALTNTGNATATDIYIQDVLPSEVMVAPGSLDPNPPSSIPVSDLAPNATATVSFDVVVTSLPVSGSIPNTAGIVFAYTESASIPNGAIGTGTSNASTVNIQNPELSIVKSSSLDYATVGDIIVFTTTVTNIGDTPIDAPTLIDVLPAEYEFITTSLTIDGIQSFQDPNTGISLSNLGVGESTVVIYSVEVISAPPANPVVTTQTVDYSYLLGPNTRTGSQDSNPTSTTINYVDLTGEGNFVKTSNTDYAGIGDTITYYIDVKNTGNVVGTNSLLIDTLPDTLLFVGNSIKINNSAVPGDITLGISLGNLDIDQLISVEFEAIIVSIPASGIIENSAEAYFNFTLDPSIPDGASSSAASTMSSMTVLQPEFTGLGFELSQDVDVITMNEYVTYTVTVTNTGNTGANNVVLNDLLPAELEFVDGSVYIDNINYPLLDPNTGIPLITVSVNETKVVKFVAKVTSKPVPPYIDNTATLDYTYTVDPINPNSYTGNSTSNTTTLDYINLDLIVTTSTNKPIGTIAGDTITYTVNVTNNGEIEITDIVITEILSSNLSYIPGSVILENVSQPTYSPIVGVPIGTIPVGETISFTFEAVVLPSSLPDVTAQPSATFSYQLLPTMPVVSTTQLGEKSSVDILVPNLEIIKTSDKKVVTLGTTITFGVTIENNGNVDLVDLVLVDELSHYLEYIGNLTINGVPSSGDLSIGVPIGDLAMGATTTVFFDVVLIDIPSIKLIENTVTVYFDYIF